MAQIKQVRRPHSQNESPVASPFSASVMILCNGYWRQRLVSNRQHPQHSLHEIGCADSTRIGNSFRIDVTGAGDDRRIEDLRTKNFLTRLAAERKCLRLLFFDLRSACYVTFFRTPIGSPIRSLINDRRARSSARWLSAESCSSWHPYLRPNDSG
jgi:hypothetical protein